jgi:ABC-type nitrate/sulfonate/bicarbonate transport system permease component
VSRTGSRTNRTHRVTGTALEIAVPVLILLVWGIWSARAGSLYFPPLTDIVEAFWTTLLLDRFVSDVLPSLGRLACGYVIGVGLGVVAGFLLGLSEPLTRITGPVVHFMRALPAPAILPFALLVFGLGDGMKISLIAFGCFFPVLLTTIDGVRGIEPDYLAATRVYGIGWGDRLRHVMLPAALPQIVGGMRTSLSLGFILIVISEMVASTSGIGYFVLQAQRTYELPNMWAGMILLGLLGYIVNVAFVLVERRVLRWHRGARATAGAQ